MGDEPQVRSLLEEALNSGRSPEEVCASHPELLEEVRSRWLRIRGLAHDLERAFPSSGATIVGERDPDRAMPSALPRIPGYELDSVIGHGGMGVVYRATHLKLTRTVAVKMLLAGDYASAKELDGLVREARAVASLGHPHIVEVYDAGEVDGLPYFTMEFVEGGSLAQKLSGAPLPPREAAELVERLAAAVQVAHEKGVVHRDLKPANVLLTPDGTPKISDFGLARRMEVDSLNTLGAARVGTPSYMGPEQAMGTPEAFHPLVDVYSLGAILYETLTGRPPFRADSPLETQRQVISEDPVPPSSINRRVPQDLETICLKCLQKSPSARYASAEEFGRDLRRYLNGEPILARKTGAVVRTVKWARRHPAKTTALGFSILLMVAAIVGLAWFLATTAASRHAVEGELEEVERAQRASDWPAAKSALDRATVRLGNAGPPDLRSRLDTAARNAHFVSSADSLRMSRALAAGTTASIAKYEGDYANLYREVGVGTEADPPDAAAQRVRDSNISEALIAGLHEWQYCLIDSRRKKWVIRTLAIADSDHGGFRDRSRDPAAWKDPQAMKRLIAECPVSQQSTEYLLWFAELITELGNDAAPLLRKIQAAHPNDFWANYALGNALRKREQPAEAIRYAQAAAALRPDAAVAHDQLGNCLWHLKRIDEALEELQEAARLDPASPGVRGNLGQLLWDAGSTTGAVEHLAEGARLWPENPPLHLLLGRALVGLDRNSEAIEQFKQANALDPAAAPAQLDLINAMIRAHQGPEAIATVRSWMGNGGYGDWDGLAELCLFVGAMDEYASTRAGLLETFGASTDPSICENVGRACMLAPCPESERAAAAAMIDRALEGDQRESTGRSPYVKLAKALSEYRAGHYAEALGLADEDDSKVLRPAHRLLAAMAHSDLHKEADALTDLSRAAMKFDWRPQNAGNPEAWMCHVLRREAESKILKNLEAFRSGNYWPTTAEERLALIATSEDTGMHLACARLFTEAFASDSALAQDSESRCRYRAACAAARCGSGQSKDGSKLTPEEQAHWREQALLWLRADLAVLRDPANTGGLKILAQWRTDPDLLGVRDPALLAILPESERSGFTAFWSDVNGALASAPSQ
jgi:serine/threonine-protein kinase